MYERTDGGEFKGPDRLRRGTNNRLYVFHMKIKSKKCFQYKLGQTVQEMLILSYFGDFLQHDSQKGPKEWSHGPR